MIFQFILPISLVVCLLSAWSAFTLPVGMFGKNLFFGLTVFGLAYILPIGPLYDPALFLPYPLIICFAVLSAFAFFYVWTKLMHFSIAVFFALFALFSAKARQICKMLFCSKKLNSCLVFLCLLASPYSVYETIKVPDVRHVTLFYENLPQELNNYTIAQITDTHTGLIFSKEWQEAVVRKIMEQKPQLIVHTGDIGDARPQIIAESLEPLQKLSAPDGVYYVFGNHEKYHTLAYWQEYFKENHLTVLEDQTVFIHDYLAISGAKAQSRHTPLNSQNYLSAVPEEVFHIYLSHHPAIFNNAAPYADLQLSGHTHGGTAFFLVPIIKHFNAGFVSGLYEQDKAKLYVNNGAGIWTYSAFRLFVPSEITIFHLTDKK